MKPVRVLLVEDNAADVVLVRKLFESSPLPVNLQVVHDGEEASDFLGGITAARHSALVPDVVLLDLNLPRKSGFEVLADMRQQPPLAEVPVYVFTSSNNEEDRRRAKALNAAAFLTKPTDLTEYKALVNSLIKNEFSRLVPGQGTHANPLQEARRRVVAADETFRLLVESVKDYAIIMLDPAGYIRTWNAGAERINGWKASEILGKHFSTFYTSEAILAKHAEWELKVAEEKGRYEEEGWRVRKDGVRFWANVTLTALRNKEGELVGFAKVTRDFTERKKAEESLRESEERFRFVVEQVKDYAIFMLDPGGHIVSWNRGAERIKGWKASEILGKHFSIFYTQDAIARRHPQYELEIAVKKGVYEEEGMRVRKDGTRFWANVVITALFDESGKLRGFAKVTRDITDRKRNEEEIRKLNEDLEARVRERTAELEASKASLERQTEELTRSNADLEQFAYVASHDLQEPLRAVVSYLQLIELRYDDKLDEEGRQFIGFAVGGAKRMKALVTDLLTYSRIGRKGEHFDPVSVNEILGQVKQDLAPLIEQNGATLEVGELPIVRADRTQLTQLFQNLIGNAIKFRADDRAPEIRITAERKDGFWYFSVADNGIGLEPIYKERIFVIFQRLHADREKYPGTGIGLAICKKIVERMGGKISVDSAPGKGSTFYFTWPV